jgi:hypothetical protein
VVSGARWAGVALVIMALLGAIALAAISPSESGTGPRSGIGAEPATPQPASIEPDARIPAVQPRIISPEDGITTDEYELRVTITVPEYELPTKALSLQVYRNGQLVGTVSKPRADDNEVGPIKLVEGRNNITAALVSSSGVGPMSDPIAIDVDKMGPDVNVTSPRENDRIFTRSVTVIGTTEVGAEVTVKNATNDRKREETVGPSGKFEMSILLEDGNNRIVITVVDAAGNRAKRVVRTVTRIDRKPKVVLRLSTNEIKVSSLPKPLRMIVTATDSTGKPIEGAQVSFHLSVSGQETRSQSPVTNERGQASWRTTIEESGARRGEGFVTVEVKANGGTGEQTKVLTLK